MSSKVLFITEHFPSTDKCGIRGGAEARSYYLAKELVRKGNDVSVICSREVDSKYDYVGGIKVHRVGKKRPYDHTEAFLARFFFIFLAYFAAMKIENVDVVDGTNFISYVPAYFIARTIGAKAVATYHDTWVGRYKTLFKFPMSFFGWTLERFVLSLRWDLIIAVSNYTKNNLKRFGHKVKVVHNGVDVELCKSITPKKHKELTLLYVGRLVDYKNVHKLIGAMCNIKGKLFIIGSGPEEKDLKMMASFKNELWEGDIEFKGFLPSHKDVLQEMANAHYVVLLSSIEGFGMVIVESACVGTPYICSNIPPLKEASKNGKAGFIIKDASQIKKVLKKPLPPKSEFNEIRESYNWKNITKKYEKAIGVA
jgi:glycosyltransferase involved in cell wall biosynthesis